MLHSFFEIENTKNNIGVQESVIVEPTAIVTSRGVRTLTIYKKI